MNSTRALALVAVLTAALSGCSAGKAPTEKAPYKLDGDVLTFLDDSARQAAIRVATVTLAADTPLSLTGRLVWDEDATVRVFTPVGGRVERIAADLGARVQADAVLATLASPDFGQAQTDAARAHADLVAAERSVERARLLFERGATPRKDLDQAEAEIARARAEDRRTEARLRLWGGAHAQPGEVDQTFQVTTPIAGVVVERNLNPGQEVRIDASAPLFVVSDPRRLWVALDVTEGELGLVAAGSSIEVRTPAYPERSFPGTLSVVGASLDPATRTARARGKLANPDGLLRAEMYVTVKVLKTENARRLMVPARCVLQEGERSFLFVEEVPGRYRRTEVRAGAESEGAVPILGGLADGARVVTEGNLLLESAWAEGQGGGGGSRL